MEYKSPEKIFLPVVKKTNLPVVVSDVICLKLVAVIPHEVSGPVDGTVDSPVGTKLDTYV